MGVHGLWDLLAPVGRRVSVETLSGKKLAIDASIWMVQFMKAMRDERGEMVRNAHLLGFFRRICKLLFLRTKPVFVFDGGTPVLKRRTVIARRRQRENAQAKIRKTAEKLLLNHLKAMRLKDLAKDLENQRKNRKNDAKGKEILIEQGHVQDCNTNEERNIESADAEINNEENLGEMLAASLVAEKDRHLNNNDLSTAHVVPDGDEGDSEENEEIIWPGIDGSLDPAVLAALPTAMQLDLMMRNTSMEDNGKNREAKKDEERNGNAKSKEVFSKEMDILERDNVISKSYNQSKLDEMLAASPAAEESESLTKIASTSDAEIPLNFEGDDEDEEMILPAFSGKVDPAILAALPPSMQLDLLVQMRERLMAENRKKYQKVKKAPEKFSELQIEAYLKTVSFRREIDQVQKAAAGKDVGGIQTSRIASEASKEFIFSSSFTGDKKLLTSAGVHGYGEKLSDSVNHIASTGKSATVSAFVQDESSRIFNEDVETYVDERGRVRVSRVRAMGIRMTRDLQRNLDLMKEIELERTHPIKTTSSHSELCGDEMGSQKSIPSKEHNSKLTNDYNANSVKLSETNVQPIFNNESSIQISFEVDGDSERIESDDDVFTSLVVGQPVMISSDSASDSDWVEGIIDRNDECSSKDFTLETNASVKESYINDDSEVKWEEVVCDVRKNANSLSRDKLVEQSDLEEAIRRSLEDFGGQKVTQRETGNEKIMSTSEVAHKGVKFFDTEANSGKMHLVERDGNQQNKPFPEISAAAKLDSSGPNDSSHLFSSPQKQLKFSEACDTDNLGMRINRSCQPDLCSDAGQPTNIMNKIGNLGVEIHSEDSVEAKEIDMIVDGPLDTCVEDVRLSTASKTSVGDVSVLKTVSPDKNFSASVDVDANKTKTEISLFINEKKFEAPSHAVELTNRSEPFEGSRTRILVEAVSEGEKKTIIFNENDHSVDEFPKDENLQGDFSEANLQEEILCLNQERVTLGHEQKKLERNAESVSSEMFAECQELLQMFGIPYIIAPMEAEAQCAYMELANLVDGVVTDDSDVFLFGGRSVYKNIFDDRKYVETYFMKDIEKELGLTREKLIHMALLLGSDYTEGISGIGIVNAIEVVNAFPEEDGLEKFREWIDSPDPNILGKFDANRQAHGRESCTDHYQLKKQIFMNKHRTVSKNWHVPSSFPSKAVMSAYFSPQVDKSTDPFTWGKPDINVLRRLCWEKFGWGVQKSDELLIPVLKEYNKHETQLRLEAFYSFNERFAKIRSNRIKKAVKGITGNQSSGLMDDAVVESSRSRKKRTSRSGESGDINTEKPSKRAKRGVRSFKNDDPSEKALRKQSRKRTAGEPVSSEVEIRGRGRGQGHRRGRGRDLGKGILDSKQSDSSSDDFSGGCDNLEVCVGKSEISGKLRRSTRTRKPANYVPNDSDIDDVELSDQEAIEQSDLVRLDVECKDTGKSQNCQEHRSAEDPLPEDFSRDHLQVGVGFVNEDGSGNAGASQDNCPYEAVSTEDYLKMGGGFCLDESEMDAEQDAACSPSLAAARDAADVSSVSNLMEEAHSRKDSVQSVLGVKETSGEIQVVGRRNSTDANMGLDCANKADTSGYLKNLQNITESKTALPSLSAMPFLKRKRRKSLKQTDA